MDKCSSLLLWAVDDKMNKFYNLDMSSPWILLLFKALMIWQNKLECLSLESGKINICE
jgi:hypothetical protein